MHISLYRRYRPQRFSDITGQSAATGLLRSAVSEGRLGHAYLFSGPRGCGKTTAARVIAKAANCMDAEGLRSSGEPCCECESCRAVAEGRHLDVMEIDAASNRGIDDIRELRENVSLLPMAGRTRVYILDEVHMLSLPAFNALLKTLEEPPDTAMFVLATTDPNKVPVTIRSRCQHVPFHRINAADIAARLAHVMAAEGIETEDAALREIARCADGALRDALSLAEQAISFSGKLDRESVYAMLGSGGRAEMERWMTLLRTDPPAASELMRSLFERGASAERVLDSLFPVIRDLWTYSLWGERALAEETGQEERAYVVEEAKHWSADQLRRCAKTAARLIPRAKWGLSSELFAGLIMFELLAAREDEPTMYQPNAQTAQAYPPHAQGAAQTYPPHAQAAGYQPHAQGAAQTYPPHAQAAGYPPHVQGAAQTYQPNAQAASYPTDAQVPRAAQGSRREPLPPVRTPSDFIGRPMPTPRGEAPARAPQRPAQNASPGQAAMPPRDATAYGSQGSVQRPAQGSYGSQGAVQASAPQGDAAMYAAGSSSGRQGAGAPQGDAAMHAGGSASAVQIAGAPRAVRVSAAQRRELASAMLGGSTWSEVTDRASSRDELMFPDAPPLSPLLASLEICTAAALIDAEVVSGEDGVRVDLSRASELARFVAETPRARAEIERALAPTGTAPAPSAHDPGPSAQFAAQSAQAPAPSDRSAMPSTQSATPSAHDPGPSAQAPASSDRSAAPSGHDPTPLVQGQAPASRSQGQAPRQEPMPPWQAMPPRPASAPQEQHAPAPSDLHRASTDIIERRAAQLDAEILVYRPSEMPEPEEDMQGELISDE